MSKRGIHLDPSDHSAGMASGTTVFEVVSIDDPNKSGRVLVRPVGSMEQFPDASQMQWIPMSHTFAPNRGWGFSGVPYEVGTKVMAQNNGQQGWIITGAIPNTLTDNKGDQHPEIRDEKAYPHSRLPGGNGEMGNKGQGQRLVGSDEDHRRTDGQSPDVQKARKHQDVTATVGEDDTKKRAKQGPAPERFYRRSQIRNDETQIGFHPFSKGDMQRVDKFMQSLNIPFALPQTPSILDALTNTGKSGSLIQSEISLGGSAIISAAISAASSARSAVQSQDAQNQLDPLLEFLLALYRELTGLDPYDARGALTVAFKAWRTAYLAAMAAGETS